MRARVALSLGLLVAVGNISAAYADAPPTIVVSTPQELADAFDAVNQSPYIFFYVELLPGTYNMDRTLILTGQMELDGAWTLADAQNYVLDWGATASNAHGSGRERRGIQVQGGGVLVSGGFVLRNGAADSTVPGSTGHGGILEIQSGYVWMDTAVITGGWANSWGAGVSVSGDSSWLDLSGVVLSNNKNSQATDSDPAAAFYSGCGGFNNLGGGLAVTAGAGATVTNSTIVGNRACAAGGIYFSNGSSLQVVNSTIDGNASGQTGAGVYLNGGGTVSLNFSTIRNNTTAYDPNQTTASHGGGLDLSGFTGSLTMVGDMISGNHLHYKRVAFPLTVDYDHDATRDCSLEGSVPTGAIFGNVLGVRGDSSADGSCFSVFDYGGTSNAPVVDNLLPLSSDLMPVDRPDPSKLRQYYSPDNNAPIFCPDTDQLGAGRPSQWLCQVGAVE